MITLRNILVSAAALLLICATGCVQDAQKLDVSLKRPVGATAAPSAQGGFIQRWIILDPLRFGDQTENAVQAYVKTNLFPEQFTVVPHDGDKVTATDGSEHIWHAVETERYNVDLYQFGRAFNKSSSTATFWAVTLVDCPREMSNVRLAIGSNAASVWWLNGQEVVGIYGDRQTVIDDGVSKRVTLKKGLNVIRMALVNSGGASDFCARFLDSNDQPIRGLTVSLPVAAK